MNIEKSSESHFNAYSDLHNSDHDTDATAIIGYRVAQNSPTPHLDEKISEITTVIRQKNSPEEYKAPKWKIDVDTQSIQDYTSAKLKIEREIVLNEIKYSARSLKDFKDTFKNDEEIVLAAVEQDDYALNYAASQLKSDAKFVLAAVKKNGLALAYVSPDFKNDEEIVLAAVNQKGRALEYASNKLKKDKEIVLAAVKQDGFALQYAAPELKMDKDVVLAAVKQNGFALDYAAPEFKNDRDIILDLVKYHSRALTDVAQEFKNDREIVLAAVKKFAISLGIAGAELNNDKNFVLDAVKQNGKALRYALAEFKNDKDVVLAAVEQDGEALQYVSDQLRNDKDVVLAAVRQTGYALQYASGELKKDKDVVLAAVKQTGHALQYAAPELKNDEEIVLAAVKQNDYALQYAAPKFKNDRKIILAAVERNSNNLYFASSELNNDEAFILLCLKKNLSVYSCVNESLKNKGPFLAGVFAQNPFLIALERGPFVDESIKKIVMRIRKQSIQDQLFAIAAYFREKKHEKPEDLIQNYPTHLQLIVLCLRFRFPDSGHDISSYLKKFDGKWKSTLKDQNRGVQEAMIKLLICNPCLQQGEIEAFFNNLPEPQRMKEHLDRISNFIFLASDDQRQSLPDILNDHNLRNERLIAPCLSFLQKFVSVEAADKVFDAVATSPVIDEFLYYLNLHKKTDEIHPAINRMLLAIAHNDFQEERYRLSSSPHLTALQSKFPDLWGKWSSLSSYRLQTPIEECEKSDEKNYFHDFLIQKLNDGHLHRDQDFVDAIRSGANVSNPNKQACLEMLRDLSRADHLPNRSQIYILKTLLCKNGFSTDEFEHDLDSLIENDATLAELEVSDKWADLLLSGVEGSCLRIDGQPAFNKCLLAYLLDGKNQMLCVKDRQGKIVGRSILRLLFQEDGSPCIFMERFYGNVRAQQSIVNGAKEIARLLNLELYAGGVGLNLYSFGSSVPFEYSDAGDGVTNGIFSHQGELVRP